MAYSQFGDGFLSMTPNSNVENMSRVCLDRLVHSKAPGLPGFLVAAGLERSFLEGRRSRRGSRRVNPDVPGVS